MYDIIIIGAGPAGMSAAIYGARAGRKVLMIEEKNYGGQIVNTPEVENYPAIKNISGFDFATNLYNQAIELGAEMVNDTVVEIKLLDEKIAQSDSKCVKQVVTRNSVYDTKAVIVATGAKNRPLGVEKEKSLIGAGVSYCATCDGMFFKGKDVAVVGGGNTALEDTEVLSNYCNKVYIIHRRDAFRGEEKIVQNLKEKDNVIMVMDSVVIDIIGDGKVEGIVVENKLTNEQQTLDVQGLFVAVGQMPDNERFSNVIKIDEKGYVIADESCNTSCDGIFVAGDCRTKKVRQLTTAVADGAVGALAASEYIG